MASVSDTTQTIEVNVPVPTAYNQWTQFEEFPRFMEGVEQAVQKGDDLVHFVVNVAGRRVEYDAEIVEQRVEWRSRSGRETGGVVTFEPLGRDRCRVGLDMRYAKEGCPRERWRSPGLRGSAHQEGSPAVQGVHRGAGQRERRMAW